jgi:outer membrane autotransporter protein
LIDSLSGYPISVINNVLNQLHPAPYSAFDDMEAQIGGQVLSLFHRKPYLACGCERAQRVWATPFGNWLKEGNLGEQVGFEAITWGIAAGYDCGIGENWVIGGGGAFDRTDLVLHLGRGSGSADRYLGSLYCDFMAHNFYIGLSGYGGWDDNEMTRHIHFPTLILPAKGKFDGLEAAVELATAYLWGAPACLLYPYATCDFFYAHFNGFSESGADGVDLTVGARGVGTIRSEAGIALQIQDTNRYETICVSPTFALGWAMECPVFRPFYQAHFADEPIGFEAKGWNQTWQMFTFDFGLRLSYYNVSLSGEYHGEFAPDGKDEFWGQWCNVNLTLAW